MTKRAGEPLGIERRRGRLRPGPHLRQPLRVLLHLPAAAGPAAQPVPQGRRLPAVVPLRELHDAHPLHRGRPRTGRDRGPLAAVRVDPRHRPRRAGRHAPQPPRRRCPCAGCGLLLDHGVEVLRPDRRVPRAERRRRPRGHALRRPRRVPRAARPWPWCPSGSSAHNREPRMRPHGRGEAEARRRPRRVVAGVVPATRSAGGLVFAADEYHLLAGRPFPPLEHYERRAMHEDGIGMAATFAADFRAAASGPAGRVGAPRPASSPGPTAPPGAGTPPPERRAAIRPARRPGPRVAAVDLRRRGPRLGGPAGPAGGAGRRPHRQLRRPGARPAAGRASVAPTCGSWRSTTGSSAATSA